MPAAAARPARATRAATTDGGRPRPVAVACLDCLREPQTENTPRYLLLVLAIVVSESANDLRRRLCLTSACQLVLKQPADTCQPEPPAGQPEPRCGEPGPASDSVSVSAGQPVSRLPACQPADRCRMSIS